MNSRNLVLASMETPKTHRRRVAGGCIFGVLVAAVFCKPLIALAVYAADADLHSHILLVPFISAYLVYIRRQELPPTYGSSPIVAAVFLVAGVGAMVATWTLQSASNPVSYNDYLVLMALSFVCLLIAGGFAFLGKKWMGGGGLPGFFPRFHDPAAGCGDGDARDGIEARFQPKRRICFLACPARRFFVRERCSSCPE